MKKEGIIVAVIFLGLLIVGVIVYQNKNRVNKPIETNEIQKEETVDKKQTPSNDQSSLTGQDEVKETTKATDDQTIEDKLKVLENDATNVNNSLSDTAIDVMNE